MAATRDSRCHGRRGGDDCRAEGWARPVGWLSGERMGWDDGLSHAASRLDDCDKTPPLWGCAKLHPLRPLAGFYRISNSVKFFLLSSRFLTDFRWKTGDASINFIQDFRNFVSPGSSGSWVLRKFNILVEILTLCGWIICLVTLWTMYVCCACIYTRVCALHTCDVEEFMDESEGIVVLVSFAYFVCSKNIRAGLFLS